METYLANYLIVILCGYWHIRSRPSLKYKYENAEQSSLAFSSFLYGFVIFLWAYLINYFSELFYFEFLQKNLIEHECQLSFWKLFDVINSLNDYPRLIFTNVLLTIFSSNIFFDALTLKICKTLNKILNKINLKSLFNRLKAFRVRQRKKNTTEPEKTIIDDFGFSQKSQVMITLKNRKVYIGESCDYDPDEPWDKSYISIIPLKSGYRDIRDLSFNVTQDYEKLRSDIRQSLAKTISEKIEQTILSSAQRTSKDIIEEIHKITRDEQESNEEKIKRLSTPIIINKQEIITVAVWHG